jgi:hypothetical protein
MGAPRIGLVRAIRRLPDLLSIQPWVVDIGISLTWKKFGESRRLVRGKGVKFEEDWAAPLRIVFEKQSEDRHNDSERHDAEIEVESEDEDYGIDDDH